MSMEKRKLHNISWQFSSNIFVKSENETWTMYRDPRHRLREFTLLAVYTVLQKKIGMICIQHWFISNISVFCQCFLTWRPILWRFFFTKPYCCGALNSVKCSCNACRAWPVFGPGPWILDFVYRAYFNRVATHQGKVREKYIFSRSWNCQGIWQNVREILKRGKCQGNVREFHMRILKSMSCNNFHS